jgi:hypothetical protein
MQGHLNSVNFSVMKHEDYHCWFQQDGATCYTSCKVVDFLEEYCLISIGLWPPRLPDLEPTNVFFWSHVKGHS